MAARNAKANEGGNSLRAEKNSPMPGRLEMPNLKKGTAKKPVTMPATTPRPVRPGQNNERIITGQKVALMPDQPKMTNQKTVLSGVEMATAKATAKPPRARPKVTLRERPTRSSSEMVGFFTF